MKKGQNTNLIRLIEWIERYPGYWDMACDSNDEHMNMGKMQMIVKSLAQAELYDVIMVVLTVHKNCVFVQSIEKELMLQFLKKQIQDDKRDKLINFITKRLE